MRLSRNARGMSKLILILLLLISFVLGAFLSYLWTMGFYSPLEYNLPEQANVTVENVQFFPEDATSFNVTVLNPSYSSDVVIEQIKVETPDGELHTTTSPSLPIQLARGASQTLKSYWSWGNYTGQNVRVHVHVLKGTGSNLQTRTPFMNFTVTSVNLDPSVSVNHFNITVQNAGSATSVNITRVLVNGAEVPTTPALTPPYELTNASDAPPTSFMLMQNWIDLQGKTVTIEVQTPQGYTAYKTVAAPLPVILRITDIDFNVNYTDRFNITIENAESSPPSFVDVNEIKLLIENETITPNVSLPQTLRWNSSITLTCFWNWSPFEGKNVTIVILTIQGFGVRDSALIVPKPRVSFIRWSDGARVNTFDHSIVVAPSVKITNENVTHGIWNWDATTRTAYVRIFNVTNSAYIQNVTMHVKLDNQTIATVTWNSSDILPTSWVTFSANALTKYTMWLEITTTPDAVADQTSVIVVEIKTENP